MSCSFHFFKSYVDGVCCELFGILFIRYVMGFLSFCHDIIRIFSRFSLQNRNRKDYLTRPLIILHTFCVHSSMRKAELFQENNSCIIWMKMFITVMSIEISNIHSYYDENFCSWIKEITCPLPSFEPGTCHDHNIKARCLRKMGDRHFPCF